MTSSLPADPDALLARYEAALGGLTPPFAFVDLDALAANAAALSEQAAGLPIRVATKSVRSLGVLRRIGELDLDFRGLLAFTAPEALRLVEEGFDDVLVAYPTADRAAIAAIGRLAAREPERAPTLMVDELAHLDLIESALEPGGGPVPVCVDLDAGWRPLGGPRSIGPKRSPLREAGEAGALAAEVAGRDSVRLRGAMAYEGQIAGVGDRPPGRPFRGLAIRAMQAASERDIRRRLPSLLAAVRAAAEAGGGRLELVNCGGTGSLARTAAAGLATELSAGSGFYAPALFDAYRSLDLTPAAFFCLPVVRRPSASVATVLGGGYVASGPPGRDRLPTPHLPAGLRFDRDEGAGEVQTPLLGDAARGLAVGDRVYFRHAKAGELCERFDALHLVSGDRVVDRVATYRGAGWTFL